MLWMHSVNIEKGRMRDFQAWVKKNADLFQKFAPPGWKYRGIHAYVLGFGRYQVAELWESTTYGDFDAYRAHDDPNWIRLNEEMAEFVTSAAGEGILLREIGETKIPERPKKNR